MSFYDDYNEDDELVLDEELNDEETLEELDVDENGHVIEGRRRRRTRDDEYEPDFEEEYPEVYGYEDWEESED